MPAFPRQSSRTAKPSQWRLQELLRLRIILIYSCHMSTHLPTHSPQTPPAPPTPALAARLSSQALLCGRREVEIEHAGQVYRLRLTTLGKLILTK